jgi:tRNA modification GTPase
MTERVLWVRNKVDLVDALKPICAAPSEAGDWCAEFPALPSYVVSALTGAGLEKLREAIVAKADAVRQSAVGDEHIAINARHADALHRAGAALGVAHAGLVAAGPAPIELVSSDVRMALDALGEVAGRVDNERMLDTLFATFCIGK